MKPNIRQRVLCGLLACSLAAFAALGALSLHTLWHIEDSVLDQEEEMEGRLSEELGDYAEGNIRQRLKEAAVLKARSIDKELSATASHVAALSESVSFMLQHPENYRPRSLVNTRQQEDISFGVPYVHYSHSLAARGIDSALAEEISIAANAADTLQIIGKSYKGYRTSIYAGSRHGYLICMDIAPQGGSIYPSQERREYFLNEFETTQRTWYKLGEGADKPVYTEPFRGADGSVSVTCVMPYYDREGFAGVVGISYNINDMYHQVAGIARARTGVNFALDREGRVIFSGLSHGVLAPGEVADLRQVEDESIASAAARMTAGERGLSTVRIYGQDWYLAYAPMSSTGWSFGTLISKDEVMSPARDIKGETREAMEDFRVEMEESFAASAAKGLLVALVVFGLVLYLSRRIAGNITNPIYKLREGVREIAAGNLREKVRLETGDELQELAESFNTMTDDLQKYMENLTRAAEEKERTQTEMKAARAIQRSMLPGPLPARQEFSLAASMQAAKEVGGDFYDYYLLDEDHLMFTMADVSGKGVPASLFMVRAMNVLRNLGHGTKEVSLAELVGQVNDELCRGNDAMMFVTAFVGLLDLRNGHLAYVNAGHTYPMFYRQSEGRFDQLQVKRNFVLGGMEGVPYQGQEVTLQKGDVLFLYTDGVTEAENEREEFYGEEALQAFLNSLPPQVRSPQEILTATSQELTRYANGAEQSDDITMLALRYEGK